MNAISRVARLRVARQKKSVRPKPPPAQIDVEGARNLSALIKARNKGLTRWDAGYISNETLARLAAPYGGAPFRTSWTAYRNGRRAVPKVDMLIVAQLFDRTPQEVFPSWPFPELTPFRPSQARLLLASKR